MIRNNLLLFIITILNRYSRFGVKIARNMKDLLHNVF